MKILILASLLGASAIGGVAAAQEEAPLPPPPPGEMGPMHHGRGPMGGPGMLPKPDANGVITKQAVLADVDQRFAALDTNHDGKVSAEERRAGMEKMRMRMMAEHAAQAPKLPDETLADARERAMKRFDRLDTNHDGKLDKSELEAGRQRMMAMRDRMRGSGGREFAPPPPPEDGPPPPPPADAPLPPPGN